MLLYQSIPHGLSDEVKPADSLPDMGERSSLDLTPRHDVIWARFMVGKASIQFVFLGIR